MPPIAVEPLPSVSAFSQRTTRAAVANASLPFSSTFGHELMSSDSLQKVEEQQTQQQQQQDGDKRQLRARKSALEKSSSQSSIGPTLPIPVSTVIFISKKDSALRNCKEKEISMPPELDLTRLESSLHLNSNSEVPIPKWTELKRGGSVRSVGVGNTVVGEKRRGSVSGEIEDDSTEVYLHRHRKYELVEKKARNREREMLLHHLWKQSQDKAKKVQKQLNNLHTNQYSHHNPSNHHTTSTAVPASVSSNPRSSTDVNSIHPSSPSNAQDRNPKAKANSKAVPTPISTPDIPLPKQKNLRSKSKLLDQSSSSKITVSATIIRIPARHNATPSASLSQSSSVDSASKSVRPKPRSTRSRVQEKSKSDSTAKEISRRNQTAKFESQSASKTNSSSSSNNSSLASTPHLTNNGKHLPVSIYSNYNSDSSLRRSNRTQMVFGCPIPRMDKSEFNLPGEFLGKRLPTGRVIKKGKGWEVVEEIIAVGVQNSEVNTGDRRKRKVEDSTEVAETDRNNTHGFGTRESKRRKR
ncbi:hypothetical protein BKA69DRAFT_802632 [Paraphysoderma sedebokerense]|nr:hypothetical protein BKA69DRAFT_802632 [Paraphysoderma sedebokerense]